MLLSKNLFSPKELNFFDEEHTLKKATRNDKVITEQQESHLRLVRFINLSRVPAPAKWERH